MRVLTRPILIYAVELLLKASFISIYELHLHLRAFYQLCIQNGAISIEAEA
jgi:hypothetical protein